MGDESRDAITPVAPEDHQKIEPMIRIPSGDFIDLRAIKATKRSDYGKLIVLFSTGPRPVIFTYFEEDAKVIIESLDRYYFAGVPWKKDDLAILENES